MNFSEKLLSEAEGYAAAVVNNAHGDTVKFLQILKEYKRAPQITKKRIYIETMENLFKKFKKVTIVDPKVKGLLPIYNGKGE